MIIIKSVAEMRDFVRTAQRDEKTIGLVPTMGYLHDGHLSLIKIARQHSDIVVTSIYINPTQFGENEDIDNYPRDFERDEKLAADAGCDVIFLPTDQMMYPENYQTFVQVGELTKTLCGTSRPTHFRGVTTIVTKLFNCVRPTIAVFGQKDAQQAIVLQRMTKDLNFDIKIIVAPIVRHSDGLAMSSRNKYLSQKEREDATVLFQSLQLAQKMVKNGERDSHKIKKAIKLLISKKQSVKIDYVEIVDRNTLQPVNELSGQILVALAAFVGSARLIDNIFLDG